MLAGFEAERRFDPNAWPAGAAGDEQQAIQIAREHWRIRYRGEEALRASVERLRGEARRLIRKRWSIVESVAEVIVNHKRLNKQALNDLMHKLLPTSDI